MLEEVLLPDPTCLRLEGWSVSAGLVVLSMSTTQKKAICPRCHVPSPRVHSYYQRKPADLPCCGYRVRLDLTARRFFCDHSDCDQVTFAERLPSVIAPYARRTQRLADAQGDVALEVGGELGARLLTRLEMGISGDTVLRLIPRELAVEASPRVLGVDDWALCKGRRYGTILVDLETHRVVDLLPERSAEALATWLKSHPGVEIISRDRGADYTKGATAGAPTAVQVADRFHLVHNLVDTLKRLFDRHPADLRATAEQIATALLASEHVHWVEMLAGAPPPMAPDQQIAAQKDGSPPDVMGDEPVVSPEKQKSAAELRFDEVKALEQAGLSQREIARRLGMGRRTVSHYLALEVYPQRASGQRMTSKALAYLPYLSQRWQTGCRDVKQLHAELENDGFRGSYSSVWRLVSRYLKPFTPDQPSKAPAPATPRLSARQAAWLLMHDAADLIGAQKTAQTVLLEISSVAAQVYPLVRSFRRMISERQVDALDTWLHRAETSGIAELRRFATTLRSDYAAVRAALIYRWSNGPVEGHVHRLKLIKRHMYGRASFGLLRSRVLGAPRPAPAEP